jgi:hypothetical protein
LGFGVLTDGCPPVEQLIHYPRRTFSLGGSVQPPPAAGPGGVRLRGEASLWSDARATTPRPAAHIETPDAPRRRRHPAGCPFDARAWDGAGFSGPSGRGAVLRPPASCRLRSCVCRPTVGGHPCPPPSVWRTTARWMHVQGARRPALKQGGMDAAAAIAPRRETGARRMRAAQHDPGGPEGRQKQAMTHVRASPRQPAGCRRDLARWAFSM